MTKVDDLITNGLAEVGKPYVYGDEGPNAFDCSGLMQFVFAKVGVVLPRTADQQYRATARVSSPLPGDLVFYVNSVGTADHVALYLGGGNVLSAPHTGATVHVSPLFQEAGHTRVYGRVSGLGTTLGAVVAPVADVATAASSTVAGWLSGARHITLEIAAGVAAAALVGLGLWRIASPKINAKLREAEEALS